MDPCKVVEMGPYKVVDMGPYKVAEMDPCKVVELDQQVRRLLAESNVQSSPQNEHLVGGNQTGSYMN